MTVAISQKAWKYVAIGLMAVLSIAFAMPQAFGHMTISVLHDLQHIFDNTETIKADVAEIKAAVGRVHGAMLPMGYTLDPDDGSSSGLVSLVPGSNDKSFSGHLTFTANNLGTGDATSVLRFQCLTSASTTAGTFTMTEYTVSGPHEQDFSCLSLSMDVYDNAGGVNAPPVGITLVVQYEMSSDLTVVS